MEVKCLLFPLIRYLNKGTIKLNYNIESSIAIVVTYNRKALLLRCINALLSQEKKPDRIVIVDNASNDGTESYLSENGFIQNPLITYIKNKKNMGGAGGFARGVSYALEHNYTWLWLLDDDANPDYLCFTKLWSFRQKNIVLCPLCVDENNDQHLSFAAPILKHAGHTTWKVDELKGLINNEIYPDWGACFNGTLIHNAIIRNIGNIKSEMFIWGDEEEYILRIKSHNYLIATLTTAILRHPKERCDWVNITKSRRVIKYSENWKNYSYYRNRGYIARNYSRNKGVFTFFMYSYYFIFKERSATKYRSFIVAWCDGYFNLYKRSLPF